MFAWNYSFQSGSQTKEIALMRPITWLLIYFLRSFTWLNVLWRLFTMKFIVNCLRMFSIVLFIFIFVLDLVEISSSIMCSLLPGRLITYLKTFPRGWKLSKFYMTLKSRLHVRDFFVPWEVYFQINNIMGRGKCFFRLKNTLFLDNFSTRK